MKGLKHPTINEYYQLTLLDVERGKTISEVVELLREFEKGEYYLECAGIKLALEQITFQALTDLHKQKNKTDEY
jgi:hypothetical protein